MRQGRRISKKTNMARADGGWGWEEMKGEKRESRREEVKAAAIIVAIRLGGYRLRIWLLYS